MAGFCRHHTFVEAQNERNHLHNYLQHQNIVSLAHFWMYPFTRTSEMSFCQDFFYNSLLCKTIEWWLIFWFFVANLKGKTLTRKHSHHWHAHIVIIARRGDSHADIWSLSIMDHLVRLDIPTGAMPGRSNHGYAWEGRITTCHSAHPPVQQFGVQADHNVIHGKVKNEKLLYMTQWLKRYTQHTYTRSWVLAEFCAWK